MPGGLNWAHRRSRFDRTLLDSGCVADPTSNPRHAPNPGTANVSQLEDNVAAESKLTDEEFSQLDAISGRRLL